MSDWWAGGWGALVTQVQQLLIVQYLLCALLQGTWTSSYWQDCQCPSFCPVLFTCPVLCPASQAEWLLYEIHLQAEGSCSSSLVPIETGMCVAFLRVKFFKILSFIFLNSPLALGCYHAFLLTVKHLCELFSFLFPSPVLSLPISLAYPQLNIFPFKTGSRRIKKVLVLLFLKISDGDQNLEIVISGRLSRLCFSPFEASPAIIFLATKIIWEKNLK